MPLAARQRSTGAQAAGFARQSTSSAFELLGHQLAAPQTQPAQCPPQPQPQAQQPQPQQISGSASVNLGPPQHQLAHQAGASSASASGSSYLSSSLSFTQLHAQPAASGVARKKSQQNTEAGGEASAPAANINQAAQPQQHLHHCKLQSAASTSPHHFPHHSSMISNGKLLSISLHH